jgi:hypothetical protein
MPKLPKLSLLTYTLNANLNNTYNVKTGSFFKEKCRFFIAENKSSHC